jgi:hypothetical protein
MYVIYRKSDRLIVGTVANRRSDDANRTALTTEINNIINSELGGRASDYRSIETNNQLITGNIWQVNEDLDLVQVRNPKAIERENQLNSAVSKLTALGLTSDEVAALLKV